MGETPDRQRIIEEGIIFYITTAYPPVPAGSSVINRNLLSHFDEDSFVLIKSKVNQTKKIEGAEPKHTYSVFKPYYNLPRRLNNFLCDLQISFAIKKILRLAKKYQPKAIVAVYPDYYFLKIAREAAKVLDIPFIPYMHDTIAEALSSSRLANKAKELQDQVFEEADKVLVMSDGMKDLYQSKYKLPSTALRHSYLEPIKEHPDKLPEEKKAFWAGDVYNINKTSLNRVSQALAKNSYELILATYRSKEDLKQLGLEGDHLQTTFFAGRSKYLNALSQHRILLLALDWPDESDVHPDELATIFPTKTPEYLAAGNIILVHCPENYFLARFFLDNECGIVISERSVDAINQQLENIAQNKINLDQIRRNALKTAEIFDIDQVAASFSKSVQEAIELKHAGISQHA